MPEFVVFETSLLVRPREIQVGEDTWPGIQGEDDVVYHEFVFAGLEFWRRRRAMVFHLVVECWLSENEERFLGSEICDPSTKSSPGRRSLLTCLLRGRLPVLTTRSKGCGVWLCPCDTSDVIEHNWKSLIVGYCCLFISPHELVRPLVRVDKERKAFVQGSSRVALGDTPRFRVERESHLARQRPTPSEGQPPNRKTKDKAQVR